jgi:hypothetical protein
MKEKMMSELNQKVALVTGASAGIGQATVEALRGAGYRVFGTSRKASTSKVNGVTMLVCDVTDDASVKKLVDEVLERAGRIDLLVNNAGFGITGAAEESSIAQVRSIFETNVFGLVRVTNAVLPIMRAQRSGRILWRALVRFLLVRIMRRPNMLLKAILILLTMRCVILAFVSRLLNPLPRRHRLKPAPLLQMCHAPNTMQPALNTPSPFIAPCRKQRVLKALQKPSSWRHKINRHVCVTRLARLLGRLHSPAAFSLERFLTKFFANNLDWHSRQVFETPSNFIRKIP